MRLLPLVLWLGGAVAGYGAPILTLTPLGDTSPGSTLGWSFTIQNDVGYIEITSAQFCLNPVNFPACTLSTIGTFNDIISNYGNDIIVGPPGGTLPDSVTEPYDALAHTGVGDLAIDPGAAIGDMNIGQIVLTYNLFDQDPNNGGVEQQSDLFFSADVSVTVTAPTPGVPEPATSGLMGVALLSLPLLWQRRPK